MIRLVRERLSGLGRRFWAFIIDMVFVGVLVCIVWAPLTLVVGPPLRFDPHLLYRGDFTACRTVSEVERSNGESSKTTMRDEVCTNTIAGLWTNHYRRLYEGTVTTQTIGDVPIRSSSFSSFFYPVDRDGNAVAVISNSLVVLLALIAYCTVLESSPSGMTLGKLVFSLRVAGAGSGPVDRAAAFKRNLVKLGPLTLGTAYEIWFAPLASVLGAPPVAAGVIVFLALTLLTLADWALAIVTPGRRALHDLVSGTVVAAAP